MPNNPASNPLSETHYQQLKTAEEHCSLAYELIGRCQRAGLNVNDQVRRSREQKQLIDGVKAEFFPHMP